MRFIFYFFGILLVATSCKLKEIEIGKFENYRLINIGENKAKIELSVPVKNPNSFSFTVSDINLDLTFNNKEIGKLKKQNTIKIPAKSNQLYPVVLEIQIDKAFGNISSLMTSFMKNKMGLKAKGYVKVRKFVFSKKFPIDQQETIKLF